MHIDKRYLDAICPICANKYHIFKINSINVDHIEMMLGDKQGYVTGMG